MQEWIDAINEPPMRDGEYLVVSESPNGDFRWIKIACFTTSLADLMEYKYRFDRDKFDRPGWYIGDSEGDYELTGVTHWMPLPHLPEKIKTSFVR